LIREKLTGSRRLLDYLSLGAAGLAALLLAALTTPRWLGLTAAALLLGAGLLVWRAARARSHRERRALKEHLDAQARLAELLLPVWQAQLQMAGRHSSQSTEALARHLSNAVMLVGRVLPPAAALEPCAVLWRAEREAVLAELQESTLNLQFQDRIEQVLAHVALSIDECRQQFELSCQHFDATGRPLSVDVDTLLGRLEASYAMEEERVIHQSHVAVTGMADLPTAPMPVNKEAVTYF